MAKNVVSKTWVLQVGEDNRRYSDSPVDLIPPTPPTIQVVGTPGPTSVDLRVIVPSVDLRNPTISYTFEFATSSGGPWTARPPIGAIQAESGFEFTNLSSSTQYFFRARGTDGAEAANMSAYSNVVFATTGSSSPVTSWFPNWPTMTTQTLQGPSGNNILDSTKHSLLADYDIVIIQDFMPTTVRNTQRVDAFNAVHALQTAPMFTHFLLYKGFQVVLVDDNGDSGLSVAKTMIESPTEGNTNWYMKRIAPNSGQVLTANFGASVRQLNIATQAGLNSLGETYAKGYWRNWREALDTGVPATNIFDVMSGVFQDNTNDRIPAVWNAAHTAQITDYDLNYDGNVDLRADFTANGGGTMWANGTKASKDAFEDEFPDMVQIPNLANSAPAYFDGNGTPPLPLAQHPFYQYWENTLMESVHLNFGIAKTATGYTYNGASQLQTGMRNWAIHQRLLKPDAQNTITGRSCVIAHTICVDRTSPNSDDLEYARFFSGLALLNERVCTGVSQSGSRALPLDELIYQLGAPLAPRSMGALNETNVTFVLRAPNQTVGVAKFYWAEFENGIVIVRGDSPAAAGAYPSADATVNVTLPNPGAGKVWKMWPTSYTHPVTGRSSRNQAPSINSGATVTQIAMKPWTARWVRRTVA